MLLYVRLVAYQQLNNNNNKQQKNKRNYSVIQNIALNLRQKMTISSDLLYW